MNTDEHSAACAAATEFGVRWQSGAATPLSESGPRSQSGVALRFPPHSKSCCCGVSSAWLICVQLWLY
jgi:hypothetical protein